jgi:hypothetical protein
MPLPKASTVGTALASVAGAVALTKLTKKGLKASVHCLGKDEQLRVEGFTEVQTVNGPGIKILNPLGYRSAEVLKAVNLGVIDYVKLKDDSDGSERIVQGPKLLFLGPYEKVVIKAEGICLNNVEYVLVQDKLSGERSVVKGPCVWFPRTAQEEGSKGNGLSLTSTDYVLVTNSLTGTKDVVKGPCVWFPGPQESGRKGSGISLSKTEFIFITDELSGEKRTLRGPCVWFPSAYESASEKKTATSLQDDEYVIVKDAATGERWVQKGKTLLFLDPTWVIEGASKTYTGIRKAWALKAYEYVRLVNNVTGKTVTYRGEQTVFPGPDEDCLDGDKKCALDLKVNEYAKILDQATGDIRVERGTTQVFLGPNDRILDGERPQKAVVVDEDHAVRVRDKRTGQVRLVTEQQLFIPSADESIEEIQTLIRLADHEAMIVKDGEGVFHYYFGDENKMKDGKPRSFFLPPYSEIVSLVWSRGRRREKRDLQINRFDTRAQYMQFEFNCRTKDNVELVLEGTFFWEVVDLPLMVQTTGDTSGDICAHARSQFIKHVAKVTLKEFMDDLATIALKVYQEDNHFYASRGVKVHSLEVTRYQCADESTSEVLQQIIQETTNRMNRLSQQESENEVKLFKMQGQIEQERLNGDLLAIQHEHAEAEARIRGRGEAGQVSAFMEGVGKEIPKLEDRLLAWNTLRKADALSVVSQGGASLYYTPSDVNLSIENHASKMPK